MFIPFGNDDDFAETGTIFRDVIVLALLGMVAIVIMLLPFINPPKYAEKKDIVAPGSLIVEVVWPVEHNSDVDTWVIAPAPGGTPVGYSNKAGPIFNLLRDDLGNNNDVTNMNYESVFSRGLPNGWYVINLHLYGSSDNKLPIPIKVVVSIKKKGLTKQVLVSDVILTDKNEEITVFNFQIDDSNIVRESVNNEYFPIKTR